MIRSKLPSVGTSIFSIMSEMANHYNAINLSQGFPDFEVSGRLIELVEKNMKKGYNQYAPMPGIMPLREIIAQKTEELYNTKYNPEKEITITAGATQALYTAISACVREDDEVIVFEPAYDSYVPAIIANGGTPVYIKLKHPDYSIDWAEVNRVITNRTRMIILNTPHNPTGTIHSEEDIEKLRKLVAGTKIIILSDEVYEHIIFDKQKHLSLAAYADLFERTIIISSFGKTFHTTGWKMGYCIAGEEIMKEFRKLHQFIVYAVNTPIQYAVAEFLKFKEEYLQLGSFYQQKRDYFIKLFENTKYKIIPSKGTYFQTVDYSNITDIDDKEFSIELTQKFGIASIPMSVFYHDKIKSAALRFCFAKSNETLEQGVERLIKASNKY
jgi:methionine aminotransferase